MKPILKVAIALAILIPIISTTVLLTLRFVENDTGNQITSKTQSKAGKSRESKEEKFLPIAKANVLRVLNDPSSAQFRNHKIHFPNFCIEVNAKNQLGGYVGFRWFTVLMASNSPDGKSVEYFDIDTKPASEYVTSKVSETSTQCN